MKPLPRRLLLEIKYREQLDYSKAIEVIVSHRSGINHLWTKPLICSAIKHRHWRSRLTKGIKLGLWRKQAYVEWSSEGEP